MCSFATIDDILTSGKIDPSDVELFERTDGMGKSVKTKRPFKYNEIICSYGGKVMEIGDQPDTQFAFKVKSNVVVDGDPKHLESKGHVGNFINDATGPIKCGKNNVAFSIGYIKTAEGRKVCVWMKAKQFLPEGTELFVSYGRDYWKGRGQ